MGLPRNDPLSIVDARLYPVLARYLSGPAMRELYHAGHSAYLAAAFSEARVAEALGRATSMLDAARAIFAALCRRYRADYVYRAAIASKVFLGRHSPATTSLLPEFRVWRRKADMVMLNGTSVAYEIKTGLDNLDRLEAQLEAYARMFDRIYVVTDDAWSARVRSSTADFVGLLVLTPAFTLRVEREARSNADQVHVPTIVDALRLNELVSLTRTLCGRVPDVSRVRLFEECGNVVAALSPRSVHDAAIRLLKKRRSFTRLDFCGVPRELLPAYLESGLQPSAWQALTVRLTSLSIGAFLDARR